MKLVQLVHLNSPMSMNSAQVFCRPAYVQNERSQLSLAKWIRPYRDRPTLKILFLFAVVVCVAGRIDSAVSAPVLQNVFPAGCQVGTEISVLFSGEQLEKISSIRCSHPGVTFRKKKDKEFLANVAAETPPGFYDLQVVCEKGLSSTRTFFVTRKTHIVEAVAEGEEGQHRFVSLGTCISGRIGGAGEVDRYRFAAKRGQTIIAECWSSRIDSTLRAVLELYDSQGKRLAANRGFFGVDPLICYSIPADGEYELRLHDLVYSGNANHFYRLDIHGDPRVVFAVPSVVQRGKESKVTLYGWNLSASKKSTSPQTSPGLGLNVPDYETRSVSIKTPRLFSAPPVFRDPAQVTVSSFAHQISDLDVPVLLGVTDLEVAAERGDNRSAESAQAIEIPCEMSGQLVQGQERDWYQIEVRRGEVLYFEAFGERIGSPVDLDIRVLDAQAQKELASFHDESTNIGGLRFPSHHFDPSGRWVAPADGRYLIVVRNLIGERKADARRVYRLSVRREEPDAQLVVVAKASSPMGINLPRGGSEIVDILAFRRRGWKQSICVSARNLPPGVSCPDVWIGPDVAQAPLVLKAEENADPFVGKLELEARAEIGGAELRWPVQSGAMVRGGLPNGSGRLTANCAYAVNGESPVTIVADGNETRKHHLYGTLKVRHSPGGMLDVAVHVHRRDGKQTSPVKLTGVGLPEKIQNQSSTISAAQDKGYISFFLPPTLEVGRYSFVIRADLTVTSPDKKKTQNVTTYSDPVVFDVHPAGFRLELDPNVPKRIKRGEIAQIKYSARRMNGFISKIHTELAAPGRVTDVGNLRGRGVTFVGQTESGTIQVIANENATLGQAPFLRLYAVGVVEDEPIFHGSCFLNLEIVE